MSGHVPSLVVRHASNRAREARSFARTAIAAASFSACTQASDTRPRETDDAALRIHDASADVLVPLDPVPSNLDAGVLEDSGIAPNTKAYRRVLILGDSFVGLGDGLATALRPRFESEGTDVRTVPWKAIKVIFFADDERVPELLKKWNPDLVVLVLGGNDMFVPEPEKHAYFVRKTAKLMRGRDCYWLGPPPWKKSTGMLDIIARDSAPCVFFDPRGLDIERKHDHIHPTNAGGEIWAAAFWKFFRGVSSPASTDAGLPLVDASSIVQGETQRP